MEDRNHVFGKNESQGLKGIAIIMMLIHHGFRTADRYAGYGVTFYPLTEQQVINAAELCKICVSFFAFVTGYGLYLSYKNNKGSAQKWVASRYIGTFSGYWFAWIAYAVLLQVRYHRFSAILFDGNTYRGILYSAINFLGLSNLFGTPTLDYRWWYMSAAIVFIFLTPLIYRFRDEMGMVLIGEVLFIRIILVNNDNSVYMSGQTVYAFLTPYVLGNLFAKYDLFDKWTALGNGKISVKLYKFMAELWIIVFMYKVYRNTTREIFWDFSYGLFPLVIIMFLVEFVLCVPFIKQSLSFLGKHSANMYYMHSFVMYYRPEIIYEGKSFALSALILIAISLSESIVLEQLKRLTRYNKLIKVIQDTIKKN